MCQEQFLDSRKKHHLFMLVPLTASILLFGNASDSSNYDDMLANAELYSETEKDTSFNEDIMLSSERKAVLGLSRTDQIPEGRLKEATASYLEGYIQALIDANYYELNVLVYVDLDHVVHLYNLPNDDRIKSSIIAFVSDLPDVKEVKVGILDEKMEKKIKERQPIRHVNGVWFPESTVLFPPLIANPREPIYSVAYRWGDKVIANSQIAISLGDIFPIFRWFNIFGGKGDMQIDIAACMWADFDMNPSYHPRGEWAELVTSDYILAIPVSYAFDKWAFRVRAYHISSHLGDEFIVNQPVIVRKNPSFEAIDFFVSYQATIGLRLYFGPGVIVHSDVTYPMKYCYFDYGLECRFSGLRYHYHKLYGAPFVALDIEQWQAVRFQPSATLQIGYEWSKLQGAGRKVRIFAEFHDGYAEGQFFKKHTKYAAIRAAWGF